MAATTALAAEPMGIRIDAAEADGASLEIVHVSSGKDGFESGHVALALGPRARSVVVERFVGAGAQTQRLSRCDIALAEAASLVHVVMIEDAAGLHVESQAPRLAKGAHYAAFALVTGGTFVRRQVFASLEGEGAKIGLSGLSLIDGRRHADTTLEVTHAARGGQSREFFKHIVADEGVGVYQGKVIVDPGAQKTDGVMKSQAVLLSPTAQMNNKPELEIFADDVVCGHGATVAALDAEQIFYLQARGLPRAEAEAMVLEAFGAEAVEREVPEALREPLLSAMRGWLAKRAGGRPI
jgi:Fe-S cluster assembly protein SufD